MILKNGYVLGDDFNFSYQNIYFENDKISVQSNDSAFIDCTGCYVVPGLIDIHTHGAMNFDHLDASIKGEETISEFMLSHGVTSYLAAVMTQSHDTMASALQNIKNYRCEKHSGAKIAGVYLEGPYFSQKYKGAQNPEYIRNPSVEEFNEFQEISGNCIKVISLAPETEGAQDFINQVSKNITVAVGHTDSDYETAMQAIKNGATDFTHTFNGMRGIHHREPNAVGAAFDTDAYCECIGDGIHIHQAIIRLLYKVKGRDRLIFISDSIRPAGLADGEYSSGGQKVCVTDGKAYLEGGVLAGSTTYLLKCVKNAVKFGIPLNDAVKAASLNPARAAGISDTVGSLSVGKQADILVLNKELEIQHIILDGKIIK